MIIFTTWFDDDIMNHMVITALYFIHGPRQNPFQVLLNESHPFFFFKTFVYTFLMTSQLR